MILTKATRYLKGKFDLMREDAIVKKTIDSDTQPIYHCHIRKTGGTTINFAFLSNPKPTDASSIYSSLAEKQNHRVIYNEKVFVGWNINLINQGNYSYAFSHTPWHKLNLSSKIFTFTCFRDPVKRVVSHYKMLKHFEENNINHPCMKEEGKWLGKDFSTFYKKLPKEHLLNQLYMFSETMNITESLDNISRLNKIIFTEELESGLKELEQLTSWHLPVSKQKSYTNRLDIPPSQLEEVREMLAHEYNFLDGIKKIYK